MLRFDLFTDASLTLTPPFGFGSRWLQVALLGGVLGILLLLLWRIYRYELQFISRRSAHALVALRCLIVGLIFVVAALKPTVRFTSTYPIPSRIVIAIDRSDSMGITDSQRSPLEKLELARGLKLASDLADDRKLDAWAEQLKAGSVPTDEAFRQLNLRIDSLTRTQLAQRVVAADGTDLVGALSRQNHTLDVIGFSQELWELPNDAGKLNSVLAGNGKKMGQACTDLKLPLKRAAEQRGDARGSLLGVVVLSDGQHNWGRPPGELAEQLGNADKRAPIPVYAVVCGARTAPADLAIVSAQATPSAVFRHGSTSVDVRLLANNIPEGRIKISIAYSDVPDMPKRKPIVELIEHDGKSQPRPRSIPVKLDRAGKEELTVTVEAFTKSGQAVVERFPENNIRRVTVNVTPDKAKVLVVDGEARWELHYLQTALVRDEMMETKSVVFDQPRLGLVKDDEIKEMKLPDLKLPGEEELLRNDCIILGDVSPEQLLLGDRKRLEKYVADRGGTLVLLAGKRSMPLEFRREDDPIARMLPIANPQVVDRKEGFRIALTSEGKQTDFLRLNDEQGSSEEKWASLPPHFWGVTGTAKAGAVTLAWCPPHDRAANPEQQRSHVLIARQNYGFGRVVYVGLDSTWRWRFKQGDRYHHRFWSQVIRWAASDRALTAMNDYVRFGVREPVYRADQEIEMLVRLSDKAPKLAANAMAGARLYRKTRPDGPEESVALAPLKPHPVVPGELNGSQANLPPGDYTMELVIPEIDEKLNGPDGKKLRTTFKVLPPDTGELLNLATNWDRMREIAQKSGGEMLSADRAAELIDKFKSRTATREETTDKYLWQSWWVLITLLVLMTVEWVVRKFSGLA